MIVQNDTMVISPFRLLYYLLKADLVLAAQKEGYVDFLEKIENVVARLGGEKEDVWGSARLIAEFTLYYVLTHYRLVVHNEGAAFRPSSKQTTRSALGHLCSTRFKSNEWGNAWIELPRSARELLVIAAAKAGTPYERMPKSNRWVAVNKATVNAIRVDETREGSPFHANDGFIIQVPVAHHILQHVEAALRLPRNPPRSRPDRDAAMRKIIRAYLGSTRVRPGRSIHKRSHKELRRFIEAIQACYTNLIPQGFGGLDSKELQARLFTNALSL